MYYLGNIFIGVLVSLFIFFNGLLSASTNENISLLIVHILGLASILIVKLIRKEKIKTLPKELWLYLGGTVSLFVILLENLTMQKIGISVTVLFLIIGQICCSIVVDHFGFFNRDIYKFEIKKAFGLIFIFVGILLLNL